MFPIPTRVLPDEVRNSGAQAGLHFSKNDPTLSHRSHPSSRPTKQPAIQPVGTGGRAGVAADRQTHLHPPPPPHPPVPPPPIEHLETRGQPFQKLRRDKEAECQSTHPQVLRSPLGLCFCFCLCRVHDALNIPPNATRSGPHGPDGPEGPDEPPTIQPRREMRFERSRCSSCTCCLATVSNHHLQPRRDGMISRGLSAGGLACAVVISSVED